MKFKRTQSDKSNSDAPLLSVFFFNRIKKIKKKHFHLRSSIRSLDSYKTLWNSNMKMLIQREIVCFWAMVSKDMDLSSFGQSICHQLHPFWFGCRLIPSSEPTNPATGWDVFVLLGQPLSKIAYLGPCPMLKLSSTVIQSEPVDVLWWCQTSNTLSWALYHLARDPRVQDRLYREINAVCADRRKPSVDDLQAMPYLKAVIKETLRWAVSCAPLCKNIWTHPVQGSMHTKRL